MNLVGKIFVVLILVASTVFMTMGLMVYASHQNWYEAVTGPSGWKEQLTKAKKEKADVLSDNQKYQESTRVEKLAHHAQLAKANTALVAAQQHVAKLEDSVGTLQKS